MRGVSVSHGILGQLWQCINSQRARYFFELTVWVLKREVCHTKEFPQLKAICQQSRGSRLLFALEIPLEAHWNVAVLLQITFLVASNGSMWRE